MERRRGRGGWLADAAETRASVADYGTTPQGHMDFSVVERKNEDHQDPRARQELALSQPALLTGMHGQRRTHLAWKRARRLPSAAPIPLSNLHSRDRSPQPFCVLHRQ